MPERSGPLDVKLAGLPFKVMQTPGTRPGAPAKAEYLCKEVEQIRDHFGGGTEPNYGDYPTSVESVYFQDDWSNGLSPTRLQKIDKTYWSAADVDARRVGQLILGPLPATISVVPNGNTLDQIVKILDFGTFTFVAAAGAVYRANGGVFSAVLPAQGSCLITDLAIFNGNLIAGLKGSTSDASLAAPTTAPVQGKVAAGTNLPAGNYQVGYILTGPFSTVTAISPLPVALTLLAGDQLNVAGPNVGTVGSPYPTATGVNWFLVAAPGGVTLGLIGTSGVGATSVSLTFAGQGNGVGAPTPTITYDNGGANGVGRLTDTGKQSWPGSGWVGRLVFAAGQINVVNSNTANQLVMQFPWSSIPAGGSAYSVDPYGSYQWSADGLLWNTFDPRGGGNDAGKIDKLAAVRFQLWKSVLANKVYSCLDPTAAASAAASWTSTPSQIGNSGKNITSLSAYTTDLAIGKEDGLWSLDRNGNDFPILPELASVAAAGNGVNMRQWRNGLVFPARSGYFRYEGSKLESIGLDRYKAGGFFSNPVVFSVTDAAPYINELFCLLDDSGAVTRPSTMIASLLPDPWRWHLLTSGVALWHGGPMAISVNFGSQVSLIGPVLLYATKRQGFAPLITYQKLPSTTDNPLDDNQYIYQPSGQLVTTEIAPLPDQEKVFTLVRLRAQANNINQTSTLKVEYAVDADIERAAFTAMLGPQNQMTQVPAVGDGGGAAQPGPPTMLEFFFPKPTSGRSIQFRLTLARGGTTTDTPIVRHLVVHYKHMPQPRRRWELGLICEDGALGSDSYRDPRSASTQVQQLLALRQAPHTPRAFEDRMGLAWSVFVERVDHELLEKLPGQGDRWLCRVTLLEDLATSTPALAPLEPV